MAVRLDHIAFNNIVRFINSVPIYNCRYLTNLIGQALLREHFNTHVQLTMLTLITQSGTDPNPFYYNIGNLVLKAAGNPNDPSINESSILNITNIIVASLHTEHEPGERSTYLQSKLASLYQVIHTRGIDAALRLEGERAQVQINRHQELNDKLFCDYLVYIISLYLIPAHHHRNTDYKQWSFRLLKLLAHVVDINTLRDIPDSQLHRSPPVFYNRACALMESGSELFSRPVQCLFIDIHNVLISL